MRSQVIAIRGRSDGDWFLFEHFQNIEYRGNKTSSVTSVSKDNMVIECYET